MGDFILADARAAAAERRARQRLATGALGLAAVLVILLIPARLCAALIAGAL